MTTGEFIALRQSVKPLQSVEDEEQTLLTSSEYRTVISPSGNLVQVEIKVDDTLNDVPYTTYDRDFMLKHGISGLGEIPLSSFSVYDRLSEITKTLSSKSSKTE